MYGLILFVFALLLAGYFTWLFWKLRSGIKRILPILPPANQLSWKVSKKPIVFSRTVEERSLEGEVVPPGSPGLAFPMKVQGEEGASPFSQVLNDPVAWAAVADSVIAGSAILESALKIDPHVLHAIEFSTADHIHNLADINSYVHDHFFAVASANSEGWFNRLTGYVAEQKAASAFEHAGHHVIFAPVSNQPVWDMLVDGHAVQIKENMGAIKDFVAAHPDIPVYTDPHIAAVLHMDSVHGLDVLNKDAVHSATTGTIDGLDGTFDPGFNFPFITFALSSWRELKLLFNEKTTFDRAALNVGLDVAGVGGGALLGGKAGALIGLAVPGIGTIVFGILGTIVGGIAGKMASTGVRKLPFHNARSAYNSAIEQARTAIDAKVASSKETVRALQVKYQARFEEFRSTVETAAKQKIKELNEEYEARLLESYLRFPEFMRDLLQQLETEEVAVLGVIPKPSLLRRVFPDEICLQRHAVRAWFRRAKAVVWKHARNLEKVETKDLATLHPAVQLILMEFVFDLEGLEQELAAVSEFRVVQQSFAEEVHRQSTIEIENHRQALIKEFAVHVGSLHEEIVRLIQRWNLGIGWARDELRRQAAAVGITI